MKYMMIIDSDDELSEDTIKVLKGTLFLGDEIAAYCFNIESIMKAPKKFEDYIKNMEIKGA